jgi:hypothetical protein
MGKTFKANDDYSRNKKFKFKNRRQKKQVKFDKQQQYFENANIHSNTPKEKAY